MGTLATSEKDLYFVLGVLATFAGGIFWWNASEDAGPGQIAAECGDGSVIGTLRPQVRRRPGRTREQRAKLFVRYPDLAPAERRDLATDDLVPGALSFARARPGTGEEAGWVVEGLNASRDAIRVRWEFESAQNAERVRRLLADCVVRAPHDSNGVPVTVTEADLDAARERERMEAGQETLMDGLRGTGGRLHAT